MDRLQRHHRETENDDRLQQISDKQPCAFSCQPQRSKPVQAEDQPDDEDDPIGVRRTCDVDRRRHTIIGSRERLPRLFLPNVCFASRAVLFLSALDGLKILLFLVSGTAEQSAEC